MDAVKDRIELKGVAAVAEELTRISRSGLPAGLVGIDIHIKVDPTKPGVAECDAKFTGGTAAEATNLKNDWLKIHSDWTCVASKQGKVQICTSP